MTSRLRTRAHYHYAPGDPADPRTRPEFAQDVLFALFGDDALPIIGSEWVEHMALRVNADPWNVKDAVNKLRRQPFVFEIIGDRRRGYRVVGVKKWRRNQR
jgi:hypothetical protein